MSKLKELSVKLNGKIKSQDYFNVNLGETSFKKISVKNYKGYKLGIDEYKYKYSLSVDISSNLFFSVNKPDKIFLYNIPRRFQNLPYDIYFSEEMYSYAQNDDLIAFWNSLAILLQKIELSESESIFLYKNSAIFFLDAEKDILSILDAIIDFINANKMIFKKDKKEDFVMSRIPENLKPITPFLEKYSISDDSDREQLIEEMDNEEKANLIKAVDPFFGEINGFLNSFENMPLSDEAILIGQLAELVSELKIRNR